MQKELDHDEHQFVASGVLLSREFLLPYRDYPYFHMPNLVFMYGIPFKFTSYKLLTARLFSTICGWLTLILIFFPTTRIFSDYGYLTRFLMASGSAVLLLLNPIFRYTTGLAWNHDSSMLFSLLAFVFFSHGLREGKSKKGAFLGGLFLGLGIGTRLSFIFAILLFLIIFLITPNLVRGTRKGLLVLLFGWGVMLALIPTLVLFTLAPGQFIFGNIFYPFLNTRWCLSIGYTKAMTFLGKLVYVKNLILFPPNFLLLGGAIFTLLLLRSGGREKRDNFPEVPFLWMLIIFLSLSALLPTPSWPQYFYAPIPFLLLALAQGIRDLYTKKGVRWGFGVFAFLTILSLGYGFYTFRYLPGLLSPKQWVPIKIHREGEEIRKLIGREGVVLTLAPLFPLESGLDIYRELATGPFAWRIGSLLSEKERKEMKVISKENLEVSLNLKPPQAILVGYEGILEKPLVNYALRNEYRKLNLGKGKSLWLPPASRS